MAFEEMKQRIVQELVPGKQITLAHVIANPDAMLSYAVQTLKYEVCEISRT